MPDKPGLSWKNTHSQEIMWFSDSPLSSDDEVSLTKKKYWPIMLVFADRVGLSCKIQPHLFRALYHATIHVRIQSGTGD